MIPIKYGRVIFLVCWTFFFVGAVLPILVMVINGIASISSQEGISRLLSGGYRQWSLLKNTLIIACGTAVGTLLLGAPLGFIFRRIAFPGRLLFLFIFPIPLLIPPYVATLSWLHLFREIGWVVTTFPFIRGYVGAIFSHLGAIGIMVLSYYPIVTLISYAGFSQIDAELEDAARVQANAVRVNRDITWRLALPTILSGGLFTFILALSNFGVPSILRIQVYSVEVFYRFSVLQQMDEAVIYALPLLFLSLLGLAGIYLLDRHPRFTYSPAFRACDLTDPGLSGMVIAALVCLINLFSVGLPISVLISMAGPFENYLAALANARQDIVHSFWVSLGTAGGTLVIIGIMSSHIWGATTQGRSWVDRLGLISFAFPATVAGIGIIALYNQPGILQWIYSSSFILVIAFFCRYVSFAFRPLLSVMAAVDPTLDQSARVSGTPWWRRYMRIFAPLNAKGLVAGWFLVYLFSLADLDTAILVHPPGRGTLPVRIFNLLHFGRQEWVGALCLTIIALAIVPYTIIALWGQKSDDTYFRVPTGR